MAPAGLTDSELLAINVAIIIYLVVRAIINLIVQCIAIVCHLTEKSDYVLNLRRLRSGTWHRLKDTTTKY